MFDGYGDLVDLRTGKAKLQSGMRGPLTLLFVSALVFSCRESKPEQGSFDPEQAAAKASLLEERPVTIHSKPVLQHKDEHIWLEASEGETHVTELWGYKDQAAPVELDSTKIYQFDLLQQPYVAEPIPGETEEYFWLPTVIRIHDDGRVIYDASICPLHEIPMERRAVPISYGLPFYPEGFVKARDERFPNANPHEEGGCNIGRDKTTRVFQCESCKAERLAWEKANR